MNEIKARVKVYNSDTRPGCGINCPICKQYIGQTYDYEDIKKIHPFHPNCQCKLVRTE